MPELNGSALSPVWMLPFAGILLSIALVPLTAPNFWRHHFGKASAFWALAFVVPFATIFGLDLALREIIHTLLLEFLPFIILLLALFTVTGGIHVRGNLHGSPAVNTAFLATGTALASVMGTTGAAMLLIRPLLRANDNRKHRAHVVVFFIFLVANVGGALTPLGDPPLFLGFLKGVDFFWTMKSMFLPTVTITAVLLMLFWLVDRFFSAQERDERMAQFDPTPYSPLGVEGGPNLALLGGIIAVVLMSGLWQPDLKISVYGTDLELQNLVRDGALLGITWLSSRFTPARIRHANRFEWGPIVEVAKLFAGIFLTIIPAIAIMRAGNEGVLAPLLALVTGDGGAPDNLRYFWLTGILSSVLDNAPTYLVFFNLAGGDAAALMGPLAGTLTAISAGAVFMGAMTYIGNAPNFMVKTIAESAGVKMPGFFAYLAWSALTLVPVFALTSWLFF